MGCCCGYLSGARYRLAFSPADATHCHSLSLASVESRLVLPFWYRLTRVVPGQRAVKRVGVCVCYCCRVEMLKYKLATIAYKSLSLAQPTYLYLLLQQY